MLPACGFIFSRIPYPAPNHFILPIPHSTVRRIQSESVFFSQGGGVLSKLPLRFPKVAHRVEWLPGPMNVSHVSFLSFPSNSPFFSFPSEFRQKNSSLNLFPIRLAGGQRVNLPKYFRSRVWHAVACPQLGCTCAIQCHREAYG